MLFKNSARYNAENNIPRYSYKKTLNTLNEESKTSFSTHQFSKMEKERKEVSNKKVKKKFVKQV